jgi:hypothetical protein
VDLVCSYTNHVLHSDDILLINNLVNSTTTFQSGESWVPICLAKYNNSNFVYCYITYIGPELSLILISPNKESFVSLSDFKRQVIFVNLVLT